MYHDWLDRWDERRAGARDAEKETLEPKLDTHLAFGSAADDGSLSTFCDYADDAVADSENFYGLTDPTPPSSWEDGWITVPSVLPSGVENNDTVRAKVTGSKASSHAVVVFHHWNSMSRNPKLAKFLAWRGITVVEIAMPYHMERSRPASSYADYILSTNLGRTIQSMRQAVLDGRQLVKILRQAGFEKISVLGISLGSWVAGLIAAHDPSVERASLLLTAGSLADMVWTGRATRHIRNGFQDNIELSDLERAWGPLNLENFTDKLARPDLSLQMILGTRDTVVLPQLSERLIARLTDANATPSVTRLNCGHYSLSMPPHIVRTGLELARFLKS